MLVTEGETGELQLRKFDLRMADLLDFGMKQWVLAASRDAGLKQPVV